MVRDISRRCAERFDTTKLTELLADPDCQKKDKRRIKSALQKLAKGGQLEAEKEGGKWVIFGTGRTIRGLKDGASDVGLAPEVIEERMTPTFEGFRQRSRKERDNRPSRPPRVTDIHRNKEVLQSAMRNAPRASERPNPTPNRPENVQNNAQMGHKSMKENTGGSNNETSGAQNNMTTQNQNPTPAINPTSQLQQLIDRNSASIEQNAKAIGAINNQIGDLHKQVKANADMLKALTGNALLYMTADQQKAVVDLLNDKQKLSRLGAQLECDDLASFVSDPNAYLAECLHKAKEEAKAEKDPDKRSALAKELDNSRPLWQRIAIGTGYVLVGVSAAVIIFEVIAALAGFSGLLVKRGGAHAAKQLDMAAQWNSEHNPNYAN